jgi:hypothetical protein
MAIRKQYRNRHADEATEYEPRTTIYEESGQRRWYRERKRQRADQDFADQVRRILECGKQTPSD